jgi:hypothetical protein
VTNPTKAELLRWADGDERDAEQLEREGDSAGAAWKRQLAADQRARAARWSPIPYAIGLINVTAWGWALCLAVAGAIAGGLFDSDGEHLHAQAFGLLAALLGYVYGASRA